MSLLDVYLSGLGESVTWRAKGTPGDDGEPTYSSSTITVIWYDEIKQIKNEAGEDQLQTAFIQCTAQVQQDDIITRGGYSWPVLGTDKTPAFGGEQFRIARLGQRAI